MRTLYRGGRIHTATQLGRAQAIVVDGDRILYVGDDATARTLAGTSATTVDLAGAFLMPGFVDAHMHVLMTGEAQLRADLVTAVDLPDIQRRLVSWAAAHPDAPRVLGRSWLFGAVPNGTPTRHMLDEVVPDRPVYLYANDYHSMWLNTAALTEVGISATTPDPAGGRIVRDSSGHATGHIEETAVHEIVRPYLDRQTTDGERDQQLAAALHAYAASGITGVVEMGMEPAALAAMSRAEQAGQLTSRVVGHWWMRRGGDSHDHLNQIDEAADLARQHRSPWLRMTGVKFVVDGVIDGCTAAMLEPFTTGTNGEPIWDYETLAPAVVAADAADLQIALHAIGDQAIRIALDALQHAVDVNGPKPRRHRIEHLEYIDPADIPRLGQLGVTASMQPVHADPAIQETWRAMLGEQRSARGWPWTELAAHGAAVAFGTDAPTAPHAPLPNMFIGTTRRSALDPALPPNLPQYAIPLVDALAHGTRDAAWSCRAEHERGRLAAGLYADLVVLDRDILNADPITLLATGIRQTIVGGKTVGSSM